MCPLALTLNKMPTISPTTSLLQMHELGQRMGPVLHLGEELAVAPPPSEPPAPPPAQPRGVAKTGSNSGESMESLPPAGDSNRGQK